VSPSTIVSGQSGTGTVSLTAAAASGGVSVSLSSSNTTAATVPVSVTVPQGSTSATFKVATGTMSASTPATLTASYSGVNKTFSVTVNPAPVPPKVSAGTNQTITLPAAAALTGTASNGNSGAALTLAWSLASGPGKVTFSNPTALSTTATFSVSGTYVLSLTATSGGLSASSNVTITVNPAVAPPPPPASSAQFVKLDKRTEGNWKGVYGADGFNVIDDSVSYPPYAAVTPSGQSSVIWASATTDPRALERESSSGRIAAAWRTTPNAPGASFTIDVNLTDGKSHQVALYCLDWNGGDRSQNIEILDAASGAALDTRSVSSFDALPKYLVWNLTGHVTIKVTVTGGVNAVLSGIFFDPAGSTGGTGSPVSTPGIGNSPLTPRQGN
jgi:hypothetical protein